jgi:hypothetical protein
MPTRFSINVSALISNTSDHCEQPERYRDACRGFGSEVRSALIVAGQTHVMKTPFGRQEGHYAGETSQSKRTVLHVSFRA